MGPINLPDLRPIFFLAVFGLVCAAVLLIGGGAFAIWFAITHLRVV